MPLWAAGLLLLICAALSFAAFRAYRGGGGKIFLALGIASSLVIIAALLYAAAVLLLVSSVD
jgi:hypothetical protein